MKRKDQNSEVDTRREKTINSVVDKWRIGKDYNSRGGHRKRKRLAKWTHEKKRL